MSPRMLSGARYGPPGSNPAWRVPDESQETLWIQFRAFWSVLSPDDTKQG